MRADARSSQMFGELGELSIFRRTGLRPVFFGNNLIGDRLPSFTYMLTFDDMAAREKNWAAFIDDPEWKKLRATDGLHRSGDRVEHHVDHPAADGVFAALNRGATAPLCPGCTCDADAPCACPARGLHDRARRAVPARAIAAAAARSRAADRRAGSALDSARRRAAERFRRLPLPQDVRSRVGAAAVRDPCHRRQPLRAVRERPAPADRSRARRSESLAIRDRWTSRQRSPRRTQRHRRRRLELRRRGADGAGHARDRAARAGRHGRRSRWSTPIADLEGRAERRGVAAADRSRRRSSTSTSSAAQASRSTAHGIPGAGRRRSSTTRSWAAVERAHDRRTARDPRHARRAGCWCPAPFR